MKKVFQRLAFVCAWVLAGCGTSGPPPITISLVSSSGQSLQAGQTSTITASVAQDSTSKGVTWTLTPPTGAGALSGSTMTSVTYTAPATIPAATTVTITATSVADSTKSKTITINLLPVTISLAPTSPMTLEQGQAVSPITATVSNDPMTKGVTWALTGAGAISGQTATTVVYTAPASVSTASIATVTATSVFDTTKTATFTINLVPPPSVTTSSLPAGTVGVAYTASLAATNGVSPYTWSVTSGALPGGLTLTGSTISGTPTAYGTFNFTVQVKDADNFTASANLSIKISPAPVNITTTSLPNGIVNAAYNATLQSTGGATPITWSVTVGTLPTGLVLNGATGAITGSPTTAGTSNFTVQAADSSAPPLTATKALSITVVPVLSITTTTLPNGITSTAYNAMLQSSGGVTPITWTVTVGSLPAGLTLNISTGAITGTPTTAGTSNFTVQAADSGNPQQKVTQALSITIVQQLVITNPSLPTGAVTSVYSATLQSSGGTPPVTWAITVGTLPAGLTLNANTGAVTGTPTTAGTSNFTAQATDSGTPQQMVTKALSITINPALAIATTSPMPGGTVGTAYNQTLQTNGGGVPPITWSVTLGALPGGLALNANTGAITGTPNAAGAFNFTVQAADSGTPPQTASKALSISIATAPLSVATTSLPNGVVGQSYNNAMLQSAGGTPPVTWSISVGALPPGLTLNASTGAITGSPTTAGTTTFTVMATDSTVPTAQTATKQLSIQVNAVLTVSTTSLPNGTINTPYSSTLQSSGGAAPVTWSITVGSLPPGLSLVASTGVISGTPTTAGTSNFTVQAMDSTTPTAQTATANLSITVNVATLVVTTTNLQNGVVSTSYNQTLQFSGGTPPVTWTITTGSLPAGLTLNASTGAITGTPTTVQTSNFTAKATDSTTPTAQTATANLSITVDSGACGTGSESLLNGQYAFALRGFDASGPRGIGGTFNADGAGHIATLVGIEDINSASVSGVQTNLSINSANSSYSVGSDHRGCLKIATTAGTQTFRFSLAAITAGVASTGHLIEFDGTGSNAAGVLRQQTASAFSIAQINGNYAFGVSGYDAAGGKSAAAGMLALSGGVVQGGSVLDSDDNGNMDGTGTRTYPTSPLSITSGTYSIASNGRGTLTLVGAGGGSTTTNTILYVVSSTELLSLSSDPQASTGLFVGSAMQQSGGPFTASSLSGKSILYTTGVGNSSGTTVSRISAGIVTVSGGTLSFSGQQNNGGSVTAQSASAITYTVASDGRVTFAGGGGGDPILYLVSANKAFVLFSEDTSCGTTCGPAHVESGFLEPQTGGPFTNASANGTYAFGTFQPADSNAKDEAGFATFANPNVSGTSDNDSSGNLTPNNTFGPVSYSVDSTGLGVIPAGCNIDGTNGTDGTCQTIFYIISPTRAVVLDAKASATPNDPNLEVADK